MPITWTREALDFDLRGGAARERFGAVALVAVGRSAERGRQASSTGGSDRPPRASRSAGHSSTASSAHCACWPRCPDSPGPSGGATAAEVLLDQSLTVVYRILFLLFAEARTRADVAPGLSRPLQPGHHRHRAVRGGSTAACGMLIQAISRMAHATGARPGELRSLRSRTPVRAAAAAALDAIRIDDETMSGAIVAVSTTGGAMAPVADCLSRSRRRAARGVDERVLDFEPSADAASPLRRTREARKSSGTFYTPRRVTAFLVGQTLEPLFAIDRPTRSSRLRVLRPRDGQRRFLVAACRFLAERAERHSCARALAPAATSPRRSATLRRELIAPRCLFGVDLNPTAVQLARLSCGWRRWLPTSRCRFSITISLSATAWSGHADRRRGSRAGRDVDDNGRYRSFPTSMLHEALGSRRCGDGCRAGGRQHASHHSRQGVRSRH